MAVASSGLVVSMLGNPAAAAPSGGSASVPAVDTAALTAAAEAALQTGPVVTVAADADWSFDVPKVKVADPVVIETPDRVENDAPSRNRDRSSGKDGSKIPSAVEGNAVLEIAARYVGVPYRYGGASPKTGFDCSGFTQYVFAKLGVSLPRSSSAQRNVGTVVTRSSARPGDLIWTPGHIAIYAGDGMQIDSPRPGKTIQFRKIWQSNPTFIRVTG